MKRDKAQQRRIGNWTIKETEGGWRRARDEEEKMLDKLCDTLGKGKE